MKPKLMLISLAGLIILPAALLGCVKLTHDELERIQKETPFTIITPTYLPDAMGTDCFHQITGPFEDPVLHSTFIKIRYIRDDHTIHITEQSPMSVMIPNEESEPVYYEIAGARVLRQTTQLLTSTGEEEGLRFDWNPDGLTFSVKTFNISENESLKIVESMIKQMAGK